MALIDLRQVNVYPYTKRITLGSTDVVQAITLPGDCTRFSLQFISHPGKYSHTGTDGAATGKVGGPDIVYGTGDNHNPAKSSFIGLR